MIAIAWDVCWGDKPGNSQQWRVRLCWKWQSLLESSTSSGPLGTFASMMFEQIFNSQARVWQKKIQILRVNMPISDDKLLMFLDKHGTTARSGMWRQHGIFFVQWCGELLNYFLFGTGARTLGGLWDLSQKKCQGPSCRSESGLVQPMLLHELEVWRLFWVGPEPVKIAGGGPWWLLEWLVASAMLLALRLPLGCRVQSQRGEP